MSIRDDYHQQYAWRDWGTAYAALPLQPGHRVLDLGCGIGDQARDLAARGALVTGLDSLPEAIEAAQAAGIPGARFRLAGLGADAFVPPEDPVDGLWCSFTAAYFPDLQAALSVWLPSVRPGGWVAFTEVDDLFGHGPLEPSIQGGFEQYCDDALVAGRYDFRMGRKLAWHLAKAGLAVRVCRILPDQEFSQPGPVSSSVAEAWQRRFEWMSLLRRHFGATYETAIRAFMDCLQSPEHQSRSKVHFCLAMKPPTPRP